MGDQTDIANSPENQPEPEKTKLPAKKANGKSTSAVIPLPKWLLALHLPRKENKNKDFHCNFLTAKAFIANAPEWKDALRYDAFSLRMEMAAPPPSPPWPKHPAEVEWLIRPWTDQDDRLTAEWLQRLKLYTLSLDTAASAAETVARENTVDPLQDYLRGLMWDGSTRVDTWLSEIFGAEPCEYHNAIGRRWLISAVARAMMPKGEPAKADCMLILEGAQGVGKGRCFEILAVRKAWYTDGIKQFGTVESERQLAGKWIIESSELEGIKGASGDKKIDESAKAFLSRTVDNYRAPYGRRAEDHPRRCVFAGTTNQSEILTDVTGNRRFWPVKCATARPERLLEFRDQLWAEAFAYFARGEQWWLTDEEQRLANLALNDRFEVDLLEPKVLEKVEGLDEISLGQLVVEIFDKELAQVRRDERKRIKDILVRHRWNVETSWKGDTRGKVILLRPKNG